MRIAFNGVKCGFANNGGTQTIFRMAGALQDLGAEVELWTHSNTFNWFKPTVPVRKMNRRAGLKKAPAVDVLVNTGCSTTKDTYKFPRKKAAIQWLRAHETWILPSRKLYDLYSLNMPLWANSQWMAELVQRKIGRSDCTVQYPGVPHQDFFPDGRLDDRPFTVGGLWSEKPRKHAKDILKMAKRMPDVLFLLFGTEKPPKLPPNARYLQKPPIDVKRQLYSSCDVWFAPSTSEGLHIPPMEAALCGAAVVANVTPSAGNMDYCVDGHSGLLFHDFEEAVACVENLRKDKDQRLVLSAAMAEIVRNDIGDVQTNARRMLDRLEDLI